MIQVWMGGKTPLTSIDWDASDGGYGEGTPKVITMQINYKNTNTVTTYQPGQLEISVPNLAYSNGWKGQDDYTEKDWFGAGSAQWSSQIIVGANDSTHTGYDWNFKPFKYGSSNYSSPNNLAETLIFTNKNTIEEKTNFEGSIQIVYTITPCAESPKYEYYIDQIRIERFEDECTHDFSKIMQATIKTVGDDIGVISNEIKLDYTRTYVHPWKRENLTLRKTANKMTSYDGLGKNAEDYIWVNYQFTRPYPSSYYPWIGLKYVGKDGVNARIEDTFPEGCVVYSTNGEQLELDENNTLILTSHLADRNRTQVYTTTDKIYVGYPKSIYNNENNNMKITNTAHYYALYDDADDFEYICQSSVSLNLAEYDFTYSGNLYGINKSTNRLDGQGYNTYRSMRYQDIVNHSSYDLSSWQLRTTAYFTGTPMTIKIGDDLLYATNEDGDYSKLTDDDYYFPAVEWNTTMRNGNGDEIPKGKYDCELWVRYSGESEYVLFDSFKNGNGGNTTSDLNGNYVYYYRTYYKLPTDKKVVGYYLLIKDMKESLNDFYVSSCTEFVKEDIPKEGDLHNFGYLQTYFKDNEGNLILQNEPDISSYSTYIAQEIASYDKEKYGVYLQRATAKNGWDYYNATLRTSMGAYKRSNNTNPIQDAEKEQFIGSFSIGAYLNSATQFNKLYEECYDPKDALYGFVVYDLLPLGMELESTKEEIINSVTSYYSGSGSTNRSYFINSKYEKISNSEFLNVLKENTTVNIYKNWNNTGRTKVEIVADLSSFPIFCVTNTPTSTSSYENAIAYRYNYSISYDSYLEYGASWLNRDYVEYTNQPMGEHKTLSAYNSFDNGVGDLDAIDINENGDITEAISKSSASTTIKSVISTHQDVTKYVQTDKSNYSTGTVKASPDSEYTYKLRVRTGQNDITNLVIYDSIEEYVQDPYSTEQSFITAYGTKKHWNGSFLGVDTSYAEAKGYVVKPYYSENKLAGNLYNEDGSLNTDWKEYSDSVDKSKVKSLAFEYLNKDDESLKAVLPANSQTYVLVKMQAPPEENRKILAYNGCRTQWQALDDYDRPVDFITGINSNIVKVSLSDYYDLTVNKVWNDEHNKWGLRPDSIDIILKKSGVEVERKSITKDNLFVTFTDLLTDDAKLYTIEEEFSSIYESSIEYNELEDCYEVTNTLKDDIFTDISGTKTWVGDKEANRPESITIKLLKDGEVYRTTTTNAEKDWKYIFPKVPIYNADETECIYSVEEVPVNRYKTQYTNGDGTSGGNGLAIKFNSQFKTESVNYDYVEIYYNQDGQTYKLGRWGGTALAGQTVNVPTKDFYLYWRTDGSSCSYYGFGIDSIEPADVNVTGTIATLPNYTATELTGTDYPESPNHGNYGNGVNMLWHYTGSFSSDVPAEGLFNIVNTYEGVDAINLSFVKAIEGTDEAFEKLQLNKDDLYKFQISMKNRETGNIISVPIDNKNTITVSEVPIGTYVITEKDDMYFDFVSMETLNSVEGVTFEKVEGDYVLTITDAASDEETLQIKVNNKIEPDRPYEDKKERVNLFDYSSGDDIEEASLLLRIANLFKN